MRLMDFTSARSIEQLCWQMRLADYPRGLDRARIDSLANGAPPYPEAEAEDTGIAVNVNDLTLARQTHEARMQLYQAFNKPGVFFRMETDLGTASKRNERSSIVYRLINRAMKRSDAYYECKRSKFAMLVLHGVGPSHWPDKDRWRASAVGQSDILVPSRTLLTFENLPFFAIFRAYSPVELKRLTRNIDKKNNPGWNMPVLKRALDWADEQTAKLYGGTQWAEYWAPEKREQRMKDDSGIYAADVSQTIDCWDFYYWSDDGGHEGWRRRIIFDAYGGYNAWAGYSKRRELPIKNILGHRKGEFLFTSGNRVVADKLSDIVHFQFADLSAVAPFTYHGVRSLGFLLYAACHLQNRLRCSFSEAVFENLMMYMRVNSLDDAERALKIELANRGIIDQSVQFLRPDERWQPDANMAMLGMNEFKQVIQENSAGFAQNNNWSRDRVEKTKFQVMAEVNAIQTLTSSALAQAYRYEQAEYETIVKRFMNKHSSDPDVLDFRAKAIARGVPDSMLIPEAWDVHPERIYGGGNKTMEMAIAQQLMEWRSEYGPSAQEQILRDATLAITEDAAKAEMLVPRAPTVSHAKHIGMSAVGTIMFGGNIEWPQDVNRLEVCQTLVAELASMVKETMQDGGVPSEDKLNGYINMLVHIGVLMRSLASSKQLENTVRQMSDVVGQLNNEIKGMAQRVAEQKKAQEQNGDGNGEMAKLMSKLYADKIYAEAKAQNTRESHAERTAQRQAQAEIEGQRREVEWQQEMRHKSQEHALDSALKIAEAEAKPKEPRGAESAANSKQGGQGAK